MSAADMSRIRRVASGASGEERLAPIQAIIGVRTTAETSEPVAFHIRYRDGNAVLIPITRENARADAGIFAPAVAQHYCLAWEAGPAGALIDYRIRVRRAGA